MEGVDKMKDRKGEILGEASLKWQVFFSNNDPMRYAALKAMGQYADEQTAPLLERIKELEDKVRELEYKCVKMRTRVYKGDNTPDVID